MTNWKLKTGVLEEKVDIVVDKASTISTQIVDVTIPRIRAELTRLKNEKRDLESQPSVGEKITKDEAIAKALEEIGGQSLVQAKKDVARLDSVDIRAENALIRFDSQSFEKKFIKFNERNKLFKEHQSLRTEYNRAVERYNRRLEYLHSPPMYKEVLKRAERIIKHDAITNIKLDRIDKSIENLQKLAQESMMTQAKLSKLGDKEVSAKLQTVATNGKPIEVPKPSVPSISDERRLVQKRTLKH